MLKFHIYIEIITKTVLQIVLATPNQVAKMLTTTGATDSPSLA